MTPSERRASVLLASLFALRMLGFFMVLPVFVLAARHYEGGDNATLVGLAMGIYGLTQGLLQLPFGMASDRFGRKRMILLGLLIFGIGSATAALADSVWGLMLGRALQGAGAISAVVTALLADQTRDAVRTKAMALVGISVGATFSLALVLGPLLYASIGLSGLFWLTLALTTVGVALVAWGVPAAPTRPPEPQPKAQTSPPANADAATPATAPSAMAGIGLGRLYFGVFALHGIQMALWSAVPRLLEQGGLSGGQHWHIYLPAVIASIVFFGAVFRLERRGRTQWAIAIGIALMALAQLAWLGLAWLGFNAGTPVLSVLGLLLFIFFCGFNALEAIQPSQVSRQAPPAHRGRAMGIYATLQSLGLFAGGATGGWLMTHGGPVGLFAGTLALTLLWLAVAMRR